MVLGSNLTPNSSILKYLFWINGILCGISCADKLFLFFSQFHKLINASSYPYHVWQPIPNQKPTEKGYETHRNGSEIVSRSIKMNLSSILDRIHESNVLIRTDTGCGGFVTNLGYIGWRANKHKATPGSYMGSHLGHQECRTQGIYVPLESLPRCPRHCIRATQKNP
jgi:hypothetical protein